MTAPGGDVATIILAAGGSTRMGRPKMLLPFDDGTVLSAAVAPHLEAGVPRVVVVLGARADDVRAQGGLASDPRLRVVVNEAWAEGMASSIRCGLAACQDADAVLIALGDQPGVDAARVRALLSAWAPGIPLVVPVHEDRASHPVLFARSVFGELAALRGDTGAREVVRRLWKEAARVSAPPLADIDTEEDYRTARAGGPPRPGEGLKVR